MSISNFDKLYTGMGIQNQGSPQDSGAVVKSASPGTVSVTVPANADGTQATVDHGWACISITAMNASAVIGAVSLYASDGTNTEYVGAVPIAIVAPTAGQGATFIVPIYSALVNITNIVTLTASVVITTNTNYTMELRFCYGD